MEPGPKGSSSEVRINEDPIGSATPVEDIIGTLAKPGCSNLTSSINLAACSEFPCAGGGMCDVFQGALYDNTKIAIKSLRVYDTLGRESDRRKILKCAARELCDWSKLQHRNVLPLLGLADFRGCIAMVSEWMENGSLVEFLGLNPDADRITLCMDICMGLSYIHMNDMVHGDLKAANVMVSQDGTALIADFGNVQLKDLVLKFTNTTHNSLSVRWMAPELLLEGSGSQVSKEGDVYAYGMTILEMMTGKVPFEGISDRQVFPLVAFKNVVPPRPDIGMHDDLWDILIRCWNPVPTERPSAADIKDSLQALLCPPFTTNSIEGRFQESHSDSRRRADADAGFDADDRKVADTDVEEFVRQPSPPQSELKAFRKSRRPKTNTPLPQPAPPPRVAEASVRLIPYNNGPTPPWHHMPTPILPVGWIPDADDEGDIALPPVHPSTLLARAGLGHGECSQHLASPNPPVPETPKWGTDSRPTTPYRSPVSPDDDEWEIPIATEPPFGPVLPRTPVRYMRPLSVLSDSSPEHQRRRPIPEASVSSRDSSRYSQLYPDDGEWEIPNGTKFPYDPVVLGTPVHYGSPMRGVIAPEHQPLPIPEVPVSSQYSSRNKHSQLFPDDDEWEIPIGTESSFDPTIPGTPVGYGRPIGVTPIGTDIPFDPMIMRTSVPNTDKFPSANHLGIPGSSFAARMGARLSTGLSGLGSESAGFGRSPSSVPAPLPDPPEPASAPVPPPVAPVAAIPSRAPSEVSDNLAPQIPTRAPTASGSRPEINRVRNTLGPTHQVPMADVGSPRRPDVISSRPPPQEPKKFPLTRPTSRFTNRNMNKTRAQVEAFYALRDQQDLERQRQWDVNHGGHGADHESPEQIPTRAPTASGSRPEINRVRNTLGPTHQVPMADISSPRRLDIISSRPPPQKPKKFPLTRPASRFTDRNMGKTRAQVEAFYALRDQQDLERQRQWDVGHGGHAETGARSRVNHSPQGSVRSRKSRAVTLVSTEDEDDWTTGRSLKNKPL